MPPLPVPYPYIRKPKKKNESGQDPDPNIDYFRYRVTVPWAGWGGTGLPPRGRERWTPCPRLWRGCAPRPRTGTPAPPRCSPPSPAALIGSPEHQRVLINGPVTSVCSKVCSVSGPWRDVFILIRISAGFVPLDCPWLYYLPEDTFTSVFKNNEQLRSHKTLNFFACWWKDPDTDLYIQLRIGLRILLLTSFWSYIFIVFFKDKKS